MLMYVQYIYICSDVYVFFLTSADFYINLRSHVHLNPLLVHSHTHSPCACTTLAHPLNRQCTHISTLSLPQEALAVNQAWAGHPGVPYACLASTPISNRHAYVSYAARFCCIYPDAYTRTHTHHHHHHITSRVASVEQSRACPPCTRASPLRGRCRVRWIRGARCLRHTEDLEMRIRVCMCNDTTQNIVNHPRGEHLGLIYISSAMHTDTRDSVTHDNMHVRHVTGAGRFLGTRQHDLGDRRRCGRSG